jgi:hypothetical protein
MHGLPVGLLAAAAALWSGKTRAHNLQMIWSMLSLTNAVASGVPQCLVDTHCRVPAYRMQQPEVDSLFTTAQRRKASVKQPLSTRGRQLGAHVP